jgi:hypothetical protein
MDLFVRRFVAVSCRCPVVHSCPFPWEPEVASSR